MQNNFSATQRHLLRKYVIMPGSHRFLIFHGALKYATVCLPVSTEKIMQIFHPHLRNRLIWMCIRIRKLIHISYQPKDTLSDVFLLWQRRTI